MICAFFTSGFNRLAAAARIVLGEQLQFFIGPENKIGMERAKCVFTAGKNEVLFLDVTLALSFYGADPLRQGNAAGEGTARAEAPRGEVFYYIKSDGSDIPQRVKIRTPTYANMPSVRAMSKNQQLADMPLIQASIDPCYSCTDR